jgi:hypothetical protein
MKKFILLFALSIAIFSSFAQTNKPILTSNYIYEYTGDATKDTVGGTVTTWNKPITFGVPTANYYNFKVKLTETATFAGTVKLQGKIHDNDAYTDITTVTYTGAGADTTIVFSQPTTKQMYRTYNVLVTRTSGTGKLTYIYSSIKY